MTVIATRDQAPQIMRAAPAMARPAAAPAAGLTGKDFLRILRRRKWLIVITLAVILAVTVAATKVWSMYAPLYSAEALIEVIPPKQTPFGTDLLATQEIMDRQAQQLATLVKLQSVLVEAVKDKDLAATAFYNEDPVTAPRRLEKKIDVSPISKTNLIRLSMIGLKPKDLADIVNAVAKAATAEATENRMGERRGDVKKFDEELGNLEQRLKTFNREAEALKSIDNVTSLQNRSNSLNIELTTLVPDLTKLEMANAAADDAADQIRKMAESGALESSPEVQQAMEMDGTLRSLQMMESSYATELDDAKKRFGEKHLVIVKLQNKLESIQSQVKERRAEQIGIQVKAMVRMREDQLSAVKVQLLKMREKVQTNQEKARDIQTRLSKLEQLEKVIRDAEDQRTQLQKRKGELVLLLNMEPPMRVRSWSSIPEEPSYPRWSHMIPLGLVLGLLVALGLAILLELVDTSIKSPSDVARRVDLPVLGMIPHLDDLEEEVADLRLAFRTSPDSMIGEAFRQIRTCLLFSGPAAHRRSLLIASPLPEDGRTSVALNLAAAMAQGGRKVLVVDANFRQPMIKTLFPQCPEGGLSDALVGQEKWQPLVRNVEPNLFVLASGRRPPNPAELLGSESMRTILAEMVAEYDQVILDGAPGLVVSDSAILSTLVDGVVLTVRAGANTYGIVQRTRDTFHRVGAHVLGVVLNGIRVTAGGYLKRNYETFYEYRSGQPELVAREEPPR